MFEIRMKEWLGTETRSTGVYYKYKENADKFCNELNKMMPVYHVAPVILQDELGCDEN
jgi:hypothetical protein